MLRRRRSVDGVREDQEVHDLDQDTTGDAAGHCRRQAKRDVEEGWWREERDTSRKGAEKEECRRVREDRPEVLLVTAAVDDKRSESWRRRGGVGREGHLTKRWTCPEMLGEDEHQDSTHQ